MTENKTLAELLKWIDSKDNLEKFLISRLSITTLSITKPVKLGRCQAFYEMSEHIKKIMADNPRKPPK